MELAEFLLARIAEDEALARSVIDEHPMNDWESYVSSAGFYDLPSSRFAIEFNPERVLAECEAKRRIVAEHSPVDPCDAHDANFQTVPCDTLRLLALPYADHSDYDVWWTP